MYVQNAGKKKRGREEAGQLICWLTGCDAAGLQRRLEWQANFDSFFAEAPALDPNSALVTGLVCGVRVEAVEHPLMRKIRYLDKLVDELAKGKPMEKIPRRP